MNDEQIIKVETMLAENLNMAVVFWTDESILRLLNTALQWNLRLRGVYDQ